MALPVRRSPIQRRRGSIAVVMAVAVAVSLSACAPAAPPEAASAPPSGRSTPPPASATATTPDRNSSAQPADVPEVLRFTAPQLGGGTVQGESFAGSDVALWFWAPW